MISNVYQSINHIFIEGDNNKEMWQFAKHLEEQGYNPVEVIYQWGAEKPRLKVHGLNLIELQNKLKQEVEQFKNTRL